MNAEQKAKARKIADWLDAEDDLWEFVADAISDARNKGLAPRDPLERDSGQVLEDVIAALRAAS